MPSVLGHLGLGAKMPAQPKSPGRDFSPVLRGESPAWENEIFYEMETCRAIRTERWKVVARFPDGPHELYDMQADPRERFNLHGQPGADAPRAGLARRLDDFFTRTADPQYDLWKRRPLESAVAEQGKTGCADALTISSIKSEVIPVNESNPPMGSAGAESE